MKNKTCAGLLGIFLGTWGIHHFYLDDTGKGLAYFLISFFTVIGSLIIGIMGLVEGISYLCMTEEKFQNYLKQRDAEYSEKPIESEVTNNYTINLYNYNILKKYKLLLDSGAITQQEFDAVKMNVLR